ncbi:MAG: ribose-phosphate pyrophosphokinase [Gammaproteobacteria bacterium]|nr:ribose-phosphate pyrophosphokinase [Gammaproteobacteria bacterium]
MIFAGNSNPQLAKEIADYLHMRLGHASVGRFSDGEIQIEIGENVRGRDIFLVQSTCAPANQNLMELLIMVDALRRSSAGKITAVIPYFGYARQDRRPRAARVPITAKLIANMILTAGVDRALIVDLHADQVQGFFDVPVDNVYASPLFIGHIWRQEYPDLMVVSPDVGGVVRARAVAKLMDDVDLAIIDKRRPKPNEAKVMNIIGDVDNRSCVLIDDLVDTAGTLCLAADALKERGAKTVIACCTHAVLSGPAIDNLVNSSLDELVVTNTIPLSDEAVACGKVRQLSVAGMLGEAIRRMANNESVSSLFID